MIVFPKRDLLLKGCHFFRFHVNLWEGVTCELSWLWAMQIGLEWPGTGRIKNLGWWNTRWWFQIFFMFIPSWGRFPYLTNMFQVGWFNHQPEYNLARTHTKPISASGISHSRETPIPSLLKWGLRRTSNLTGVGEPFFGWEHVTSCLNTLQHIAFHSVKIYKTYEWLWIDAGKPWWKNPR